LSQGEEAHKWLLILWDSCNYDSWGSAIHRPSLNSTVLMFALSVCLNTLSSRKYKSFAVLQEFGGKIRALLFCKSLDTLVVEVDFVSNQ
jgi:hypothetical protein